VSYAGSVTRMAGAAPAVRRARLSGRNAWHGLAQVLAGDHPAPVGRASLTARGAWRGLAQVLAGPDRAPAWRSPWQRRAAHGTLVAATLVCCAFSLTCITGITRGLLAPAGPGNFVPARPVHSFVRSIDRQVNAVLMPHGAAAARILPGPNVWQVSFPSLWLKLPGGPAQAMVVAVLVALAVVVPLPLASRYPLLGWRLGWLALLLVPLAGVRWEGGWPWDPVQMLALAVVFCVAGMRHQRPVLWWMWALTLIPWWLQAEKRPPGVLVGGLGTLAFTAAAVAVDSISSRRRDQRALADQTERTELERARRAVLEERTKIARELHDVVAHHMSLIAVRAETAPYRMAGLPGPVLTEFGSLSAAAREALADMRRLLGVLRHDQPADRAPQPQLSDLPDLIDAARQAGLPVELTVPARLGQLPPGVGVCAYRIVQESLSNASRHAPGASVTVSVDRGAGAVLLRVENGPGGAATGSANGHGPGHGLTGMRERVALLGGSLSAGPAPGGGFVVSAVLPLGQATRPLARSPQRRPVSSA
jgi:signal transduction histidine kinase